MTAATPTKVCPLCAETIKAAAKVCPYCQGRQSRFALWQQELPGALAMIALVGLACAAIAWWLPDEYREGRNFARHRDELRVVRTLLDRPTGRPDSWLSGYVTNLRDHPWRVRELEVRFLDAEGNLVDVHSPAVMEPFVVQPRQEHAFRINLGTLTFTNPRMAQSVRVLTATDGLRPVKAD